MFNVQIISDNLMIVSDDEKEIEIHGDYLDTTIEELLDLLEN